MECLVKRTSGNMCFSGGLWLRVVVAWRFRGVFGSLGPKTLTTPSSSPKAIEIVCIIDMLYSIDLNTLYRSVEGQYVILSLQNTSYCLEEQDLKIGGYAVLNAVNTAYRLDMAYVGSRIRLKVQGNILGIFLTWKERVDVMGEDLKFEFQMYYAYVRIRGVDKNGLYEMWHDVMVMGWKGAS
ncbi:hypothetical protein Tco_1547233 [Tanacetum coccineum]